MLDVLLFLLMNALFFLSLVVIVTVLFLPIVKMYENKHHAFKHHPTKDCVTC